MNEFLDNWYMILMIAVGALLLLISCLSESNFEKIKTYNDPCKDTWSDVRSPK